MPELVSAIRDLRYLLNQGYPNESAVNFVSNHYCFSLDQRHLLARCVFSDNAAAEHRRKVVGKSDVQGKRLGVDGYNVLITLESILMKKQVVRCDDGYIRDLRAIFGKYHAIPVTAQAISTLVQTCTTTKPKSVTVLFDKQVSRSGELAAKFRGKICIPGLNGDAKAVGGVDMKLRGFDIVASSDRAVIKRAKKVWDIPDEFVKRKNVDLLDLRKLR